MTTCIAPACNNPATGLYCESCRTRGDSGSVRRFRESEAGTLRSGAVLTLPVPPSANVYWRSIVGRNGKVRVLLSREGRAYKKSAATIARMQRAPLLRGELSAEGVVYFRDRRRDLDNVLKPLLDSLADGVVYANDRQVARIVVERRIDKTNPRVELRVSPWNTQPGEAA